MAEKRYVSEYVPASIIEIVATVATNKERSIITLMFAKEIIEPIIVINESGMGSACKIITARIITLFFIDIFLSILLFVAKVLYLSTNGCGLCEIVN